MRQSARSYFASAEQQNRTRGNAGYSHQRTFSREARLRESELCAARGHVHVSYGLIIIYILHSQVYEPQLILVLDTRWSQCIQQSLDQSSLSSYTFYIFSRFSSSTFVPTSSSFQLHIITTQEEFTYSVYNTT